MKDEVVRGTVYRMVGRALAKRGMPSSDDDVWDALALVADRLDALGVGDRQIPLPGVLEGPRSLGTTEGVIGEVVRWAEEEEWLPGVLAAKLRS